MNTGSRAAAAAARSTSAAASPAAACSGSTPPNYLIHVPLLLEHVVEHHLQVPVPLRPVYHDLDVLVLQLADVIHDSVPDHVQRDSLQLP